MTRDEARSTEEILGLDELLNILEGAKPVHPKWAGQAAGTIRRLQKKLYQSEDAHKEERDEALAEVETAKAVENTLSMEIASLQAEVERLKAALASRTRTVELLKQDLGLGVGT